MSKAKRKPSLDEFEEAVAERANARYVLRLYVAGLTPRSVSAVAAVKTTCEKYLEGRYELEVVNLYDQPTLAKGEQIIAAPTLIKEAAAAPATQSSATWPIPRSCSWGLDLREKGESEASVATSH